MNPRITPLEKFDPEQQELLSKTLTAEDGRPLNIFATLARHPRLLKRFNALGGLFLAHGALPARERELVILRVAWCTGSIYEFGQHVLIGRKAGVTEDEITRVAREGTTDWGPLDVALLTFADELLADDIVSDETWASLADRWDEQQLLELVLLIGFYRMVAGFLNSAGVEPEAELPGWPG